LEVALVGPGNQTDGVTVHVFRARGFETEKDVRQHAAQLRQDVRKESGRLIEEPTAYWDGEDFAAFYVSYSGRSPVGDKIVRQVAQLFFRGRLYRLTCQFAPSHAAEMDEGCTHALDTLKIEGLGEVPQ
jgi:hypothetical protein